MDTLKLLFNALVLETFIPVRFFVVDARQCRSYRASQQEGIVLPDFGCNGLRTFARCF